MNVNDMESVLSIMKNAGYSKMVDVPENAEIIFISTCAIRDNAEQKVWQRLNYFWFLKRHWKRNVATGSAQSKRPPKVVVLGCMAERLKEKILDADKMFMWSVAHMLIEIYHGYWKRWTVVRKG